jgi:glycerophosphoryl diester phosphodiesterase
MCIRDSLTSDGHIVVIHDETVERTTDGKGRISELDIDIIRSLDAGMGERIPLLSEVLEALEGRCSLNIELKGSGTAGPVSGMLFDEIENGRWREDDLLVSSFSPVELKDFADSGTGISTAILIDRNPRGSEEFADMIGASAVHPNLEYLDKEFLDRCHCLGLNVNVWTVNDPAAMDRMIDMGVDGIFTDRPDILVKKVKS